MRAMGHAWGALCSVVSCVQIWLCGHSQESRAGMLSTVLPPLSVLPWLMAQATGCHGKSITKQSLHLL